MAIGPRKHLSVSLFAHGRLRRSHARRQGTSEVFLGKDVAARLRNHAERTGSKLVALGLVITGKGACRQLVDVAHHGQSVELGAGVAETLEVFARGHSVFSPLRRRTHVPFDVVSALSKGPLGFQDVADLGLFEDALA